MKITINNKNGNNADGDTVTTPEFKIKVECGEKSTTLTVPSGMTDIVKPNIPFAYAAADY